MGSAADGAPGQYWQRRPDVSSRPRTVPLVLPDGRFELQTDRGVFATGQVDPGTKLLLLETSPSDDAASILDLGCGYGPLAVVTASRAPAATVWAVDVNDRALELCEANVSAAGLSNVRVARPDDVPDDVGFDLVVSNPPIRIGKPALHELLRSWLGRLRTGGRAQLVVQRHLGADSLARWLTEHVGPVERLASRKGYRVLEVRPAEEAVQ